MPIEFVSFPLVGQKRLGNLDHPKALHACCKKRETTLQVIEAGGIEFRTSMRHPAFSCCRSAAPLSGVGRCSVGQDRLTWSASQIRRITHWCGGGAGGLQEEASTTKGDVLDIHWSAKPAHRPQMPSSRSSRSSPTSSTITTGEGKTTLAWAVWPMAELHASTWGWP
jgi:hypothetical protein